ncbi:uncharacterized protein [Nicotiana tomentosiformis]|uniref:uncharacterized protein n=1 Tax=Nicotiana tomentosiformis TaxID=4098 RepID=UPI00388C4CDE
MGNIENMFKQMIEENAYSDAQLASHSTSIRNLEVQMGQIFHALNSHPKGALSSDTVVNLKGGNNTGHVMVVITRSGRGGNAPTSKERRLVDDDQMMQEEETPNNVVQANEEVRIDIDDSVKETQEELNPSREHIIDILEPKRSMNFETVKVTHQVSEIVHSMVPKLEDPGAFTIPCTIESDEFVKALCDLGASINLIPYSVFKTLRIRQPRPTSMRLQMVIHTIKRLLGVTEDVLVRVDKFILPVDFVILDCEVDYEVLIILGRPFLATGKAICDVEVGELTFWVGDEKVVFHVCKSMRQPNSNKVCSSVDLVTDVIVDDTSATINVRDMLEAVLLNFDDDEMDGFVECVNSLLGMESLILHWRRYKRERRLLGGPWRIFGCWLDVTKPTWYSVGRNAISWSRKALFLGQKISRNGIEVDKVKIELLGNDVKFNFNDDCMRAFELLKLKLKTSPIITTPNWSVPFELMCDVSDIAVGAVLPQHINKIFHLIYYACKIMNSSQVNYTIIEKELLTIVFAIEKCCSYLMGAKVIVHTDHATLRYLMREKDSNAWLMRWMFLLQEFDIDIQYKKGSENQMADHLSRLEEGRPHDGLEINDSFPDEQPLAISMKNVPWFADLANFLVSEIIPDEFSSN